MAKPALYTLIWSEERQHYELSLRGQPDQWFSREDQPAFSRWLEEHTSFAFIGQAGRLSVIKETRPRGTGYWYAYRKQNRHTHKRYVGPTARVTFARLEQVSKGLESQFLPAPLPPSHEPGIPLPLVENANDAVVSSLRSSTCSAGSCQTATGQERVWPNASPRGEQRVALLSTKLSAPRLPLWLVERSRLLKDLDAVCSHQLTLISASAGSGKTTLLSAWVVASKKPQASVGAKHRAERGGTEQAFAWLSLDALDNDPIHFWTSVIAALRTCLPAVGELALALLDSPQLPPLSTILTALLNEIEQVGRDIILILDDYHVIEDPSLGEAMLFLLDHLSPNLHLVIATRTDPELSLSRLRVRGQLLEIRTSDLRFSREEAASFLRDGIGLPLSEEEVATLQHRTEGWIAGLQLAALSLRKRQDLSASVKDFAGNHRHLLDYVQQDILARLPVTLQRFVLQISILTHMNASSCQAVTALPTRQKCQQMLEELERANLFVVPLDEQRQWYRYHDLFREALLARLQASQQEQVPLLHLRAARHYEATGQWHEAIAHALVSPDYVLAASLIEQAAPTFWLSGKAAMVQNWVLMLPDATLCDHTRLALDGMLCLLNSVQISTKEMYVSVVALVEKTILRLSTILYRKPGPVFSQEQEQFIERRLRLVQALKEERTIHMHRDKDRLESLCRELETLPPDEEVRWNVIPLTLTFLRTSTFGGEGALLLPRLCKTWQQVREARDHLSTFRVLNMLVLASLNAGQLHQAHQLALEGLALGEQSGGCTWHTGYFQYTLFEVYYAWNRLEDASDALHRLRRIAQDWHHVDLLSRGEAAQVQLSLASREVVSAQRALQQLEILVKQEGFAHHAVSLESARVHYWLVQGDLAQASAWAAQTAFSPQTRISPFHSREVLMLAHVYLAQQQYVQALELLSRFREQLDRPADIETTIQFLALLALALHHAGKRAQAIHVAVRLLALTEPEGYIRVYLNEGKPMKQVLQTLLEMPYNQHEQAHSSLIVSVSFVSKLLAAFGQEEKNEQISSVAETTTSEALPLPLHVSSASPTLLEPLTRREQEVLHLLAAGASNQEIAKKLVIQLSTVKKHMSSLLGKLGAKSRTQAIARARACSLL